MENWKCLKKGKKRIKPKAGVDKKKERRLAETLEHGGDVANSTFHGTGERNQTLADDAAAPPSAEEHGSKHDDAGDGKSHSDPNGEPQAGAGAAGAGQGGAADGAAAEEGGQGGVEAMETDGAAAKKKKSKAKAAGKEAKPRPFNELTKVSKRLPFHTRKKLKRKQTAKLR